MKEQKKRPFQGVVISGGPVTTKEANKAGIIKTDPPAKPIVNA